MTLTYSGTLDRNAVIRSADLVADLVGRPEVAEAWTRESSCAGMTVGGLARHLVEQSLYIVEYLAADPAESADAPAISLLDHYAHSDWAHEGPDGASNRSIRDEWNEQASLEGPKDTVALQSDAVDRLPTVLADAPTLMYLPWQEVRLPTDDFLVTRMMEIVVHCDDLADSLGVPVPEFGSAVLEPVVGLLAALAVVRHGQDAVVRTLTRPQRAPDSIAVFGG